MTGIVDWAAGRARMILAFVILSLAAGMLAYVNLPKEGEPDIEVPALFVSVPFPGISAEDSEKLLVKPLETELRDLDGLKQMSSTAAENYAGVALEFEFGWDKSKTLADVRDRVNTAQAKFPDGAEQYSINEINFSEFPIMVVSFSGSVPERALLREVNTVQDDLESLAPILSANLVGHRDEMLEVVIDPIRLESYNLTAGDLINVVVNNNRLIAAGEIETATGAFGVKIPAAFDSPQDIYDLPVKSDGDRTVTLGDLAEIRLTFEDATGTARYNGETTVALQIVKRKGFNVIETAEDVRAQVAASVAEWPEELQDAVRVDISMDTSKEVASMVEQLQASVLTAIALVMIVVLSTLGLRSALLVGFAIPTSFMLAFAMLAVFGIAISNIVMFGLILAVGMLVDGAIVVVEYADKRIQAGTGPMTAYREAAKRMFWPIISSTATTLCAFLPMLFWPGVAGEFMGNLPRTLIFVLSASLVVALIYLPVVGGVSGRISRAMHHGADWLRRAWPVQARAGFAILCAVGLALGFLTVFHQDGLAIGAAMFLVSWVGLSLFGGSLMRPAPPPKVSPTYRRTPFGRVIQFIAGNAVMPFVAIALVVAFVIGVFGYYAQNNNGVKFFVETEPERAIAYVRARGNLSLEEKDALVSEVEQVILGTPGVASIFAFAGEGGLSENFGSAGAPSDAIGQVQIELDDWETRFAMGESGLGNTILDRINAELEQIPGIYADISEAAGGPAQGKPLHLRISGNDWQDLLAATETVRQKFAATPGLRDIEDTRPLPGIDWQIDVDVEKAGRFGADVTTVGAMVQLVTRGLTLDTMRVESSDEEIDIRVRLPEEDRVLATLDTLKVRTAQGLIPLSNFISRQPVPQLGQIDRIDGARYFDIKADVLPDLTAVQSRDGGQLALLQAVDGPAAGGVSMAGSGGLPGLAPAGPDWYRPVWVAPGIDDLQALLDRPADYTTRPVTANERIDRLTGWLETEAALPEGIGTEWTGDREDQAESQAFLGKAFLGALGLMFVILLTQFNSIYNSALVLIAVVLSVTGSLIGMLVMGQPFSVIMTGTGIVALAGIVVNNNIVLIDTYQEFARYMPRIEAIIRTAEARIRPVLLTTITTMAGLTPMMLGLSLDFINGGYSLNAPSSLWWKQLATAVVFGLGVATVLTLVVTPALLAVRVWAGKGAYGVWLLALSRLRGDTSAAVRDRRLRKALARDGRDEITWTDEPGLPMRLPPSVPRAAE